MNILLFNFSKRANSTKRPDDADGTSINVKLKEETSIYSPSFILNTNPFNFNYLKFGNKYYYITDATYINNGIYQIDCNIDLLASYKSNILGTNAFVMYSSSVNDTNIPDNRLSTVNASTVTKSADVSIFENVTDDIFCVLTYKGKNSGPRIMNLYTAMQILESVWSDGFWASIIKDAGDYAMKQVNDVSTCIVSLRITPIYCNGALGDIYLGNYNTQHQGGLLNPSYTDSVSVTIPWQYNDFRNRSEYTKLSLYLPGYGEVQLNSDDFIGKTSITIRAQYNPMSQDLTYLVDGRMKFDCNIGIDIPISANSTASIGSIVGGALGVAGGVVGSVISGGVGMGLGLASASASAINGIHNSLVSNPSSVGSSGGGSSWYCRTKIACTVISHNTTVSPDQMNDIQGRPYMRAINLTNLKGYVQTINISVDCDLPDDKLNQLNSMLDGGVYIE